VTGLIVVACVVGWISYQMIEVPYGLLAKNILKKASDVLGQQNKRPVLITCLGG